jgi:dCMP deaminase
VRASVKFRDNRSNFSNAYISCAAADPRCGGSAGVAILRAGAVSWTRTREADVELDALIDLAARAATSSPNRIRQVGAAILTCDGGEPIAACNTFPAGVADLDWRHDGDGRLVWMEHAERNAIFAAARQGRALSGATIASTFFPCIDCARAIVQTGITRLLSPEPELDDPIWGPSFLRSRVILEEGGVELVLRDA